MTSTDYEQLPFLAGKDAIIQRMADLHALATFNDPTNWRNLLDAGQRAIASAYREVESASTAADAATAGIRMNAYETALANAYTEMLAVAHRRLQHRPEFHPMGFMNGLIGFGRDTVGGPLKIIPSSHWEAGTVNWTDRTLTVEDMRWHGIRVLDLIDVDIKTAADLTEESESAPAQSGAGHPTSTPLQTVAKAALDKFLDKLVAGLSAGNPGLTENSLHDAAVRKFSNRKVPRQMVRDWIKSSMPEAKRFQKGQTPG